MISSASISWKSSKSASSSAIGAPTGLMISRHPQDHNAHPRRRQHAKEKSCAPLDRRRKRRNEYHLTSTTRQPKTSAATLPRFSETAFRQWQNDCPVFAKYELIGEQLRIWFELQSETVGLLLSHIGRDKLCLFAKSLFGSWLCSYCFHVPPARRPVLGSAKAQIEKMMWRLLRNSGKLSAASLPSWGGRTPQSPVFAGSRDL